MDLHSGDPFWLVKNGLIHSYPSAREDMTKDVIVLGGGITGALIAYNLCKIGVDAIVVDQRNIGMGSTCASTSLLQYEIDIPLYQLTDLIGRKDAERSYDACLEAIDILGDLCTTQGMNADFEPKQSLYYASVRNDLEILQKEYQARKQMGITLELLSTEEVQNQYGFKTAGALRSQKAAQLDAYKLTHQLLGWCQQRGLTVVDNTEVQHIIHKNHRIQLTTKNGYTITGKKIVYATGYEALQMLEKRIATLHATYAIVSEPIPHTPLWPDTCLIWETAQPYLYVRSTSDQRILIGGKDEPFYSPVKRDRLLPRKAKQLAHAFQQLFPKIPFYIDFAWSGTFAATKDGCPYIGTVKQHPNSYFALGFGGNGITFSTIAAQIIAEDLQGKTHKYASLFSFDRA